MLMKAIFRKTRFRFSIPLNLSISAYSRSKWLMPERMPPDSPYTARSNGSTSDVPTG